METITVVTQHASEMINVTRDVADAVHRSGVQEGTVTVFVPHTTAGVMINEQADQDVADDLVRAYAALVPALSFRHAEGNSPAHLRASLCGVSVTCIVHEGRLRLGTWQGIFFCEFDGPRTRSVWVTVVGT